MIQICSQVSNKVRSFDSAAVHMQSCLRGYLARKQFNVLIRELSEASKRRVMLENERHWRCVLLCQRAIRGFLARREAARRRARFEQLCEQNNTTPPPVHVPIADKVPVAPIGPKPPVQPSEKTRAEFEKLHASGLRPFYWTATEAVRHKIGGHAWLSKPYRGCLFKHSLESISARQAHRMGASLDELEEIQFHDVYPEGISEDFRSLLKECDGVGVKKGKPCRRKRQRPRSNPPPPPPPVPNNCEKRAQDRAIKITQREYEAASLAAEDVIPQEPHPLLFFSQPLPGQIPFP